MQQNLLVINFIYLGNIWCIFKTCLFYIPQNAVYFLILFLFFRIIHFHLQRFKYQPGQLKINNLYVLCLLHVTNRIFYVLFWSSLPANDHSVVQGQLVLVSDHWSLGSTPYQVFLHVLKFSSASTIPLCSVLIIFYMPLLPEGQMAKSWEP
jgi:hypothetical protein